MELDTKVQVISRSVLNMVELEKPLKIAIDESITFIGHHVGYDLKMGNDFTSTKCSTKIYNCQ